MRLVYPAPAYLDPYMSQPVKVNMEILKENQAQTEFRNGITGLVGNVSAYLLVIPLFIFHWRLANKKTTSRKR
jgi:hypothetical protein